MKFYVNNMVPLILTFGLCLSGLNANAAIISADKSPFSDGKNNTFINQNLKSALNNSDISFTESVASNLFINETLNSQRFNNQALSFTGFTGGAGGLSIEQNFGNESVAFENAENLVSSVPEPSEYVLLACGLIILSLAANRRKIDLNFTAA